MQTHFGDPCIHCGMPHDEVPIGACTGDTAKAKPIAYCSMGVRRDGVEHFRIRWSDNQVGDRWSHISYHSAYYHFGHSDELTQPLRYDEKLKNCTNVIHR